MAKSGPKKLNWWYLRILEEMAARRAKSLRDLAQSLGVTQSWLSTVINSDAFKEAQRKFNEHRLEAVSAKIGVLADQALGLEASAAQPPQYTNIAVSLQVLESARELIVEELQHAPALGQADSSHEAKPQSEALPLESPPKDEASSSESSNVCKLPTAPKK